ncbi:hypothetical protein CA13_42480 [Planctomycetes bacterium CA13]|uniref:Uncharacterized protein n=1 Tax=Novipirellula herctigrandis TaxID=2527986 RepID=A0A5C5Z6E0_9BACT|nr:hypothetical protein CA13_42480 [Planctomycetes bacterium CA13]
MSPEHQIPKFFRVRNLAVAFAHSHRYNEMNVLEALIVQIV